MPNEKRDPSAWMSYLVAHMVDVNGNAAPDELGGQRALISMQGYGFPGDTHAADNIAYWGYQPEGSPYTYVQLEIYVGNQAASGWDDPVNSTLQTTCWDGAACARINIGDVPAGVIPATRLDPATLGTALSKDPTTKKLRVNLTGPLYADVANNVALRLDSDYVVTGTGTTGDPYKLSQASVDLAKAVNFDTTNFQKTGAGLAVKSIAVDSLIAGNALFAGDATFARTGGGKVTINSAGAALADNLTTPTATVTVTSSGISLIKGNFTASVVAGGIQLIEAGGASLQITAAGGLVISKGAKSVTVDNTGVTIVGGILTSPVVNGGALNGTSLTINGPIGVMTADPTVDGFVVTGTGAYSGQKGIYAHNAALVKDGSNISILAPNGLQISSVPCVDTTSGVNWTQGVKTTRNVETSGVFKVGGNQVVGARLAAIAYPSGGGVVDVQARTAINSILATLSAHGLTG